MAPVRVTSVISASSEDSKFPATNIICNKKWLTDPGTSVGSCDILLQLERPSHLHFIDVGYINASSIEISVGHSSLPSTLEYPVILPCEVLQTQIEARNGKNKVGCRMFKFPEHLDSDICKRKWDRIKITLRQQFSKNKSMGLEFLRLSNSRLSKEVPVTTQPSNHSECTSNGWEDSPLGRLRHLPTGGKTPELQVLEDKLLRISGTTEDGSSNEKTLSRTAKMVLSSRSTCEISSISRKTGKSSNQEPKNETPERLTSSVKKNIKTHPKSVLTNNSHCDSPIVSRNGVNSGKPATPKIHERNLTKSEINSNSPRRNSLSSQISSSPQTSRKNVRRKSHALNKEGCSSNDSIGDESCVSTETDLLKSEIKRIKKCVKNFFNSFDIDEMDPDNITQKELRIGFEAMYDVTLDQNGRQYFRKAAANFLDLVINVKKHKQGGEKISGGTERNRKPEPELQEDKLLQISGTTEDGSSNEKTLSRTAKMVLSPRSTSEISGISRKAGNVPDQESKIETPERLTPSVKKNIKLHQKSILTNNSHCDSPIVSGNGGKLATPKIHERNFKISQKTIVSPRRNSLSSQTSSSPETSRKNVRRNPHTLNEEGCSSNDSIGGESCVSTETNLSKSEIKKIKKCVQNFFNNFDVDSLDPDNVTLKRLRMDFEAMYDVTLDQNGRQYFRKATANFLDLVMNMKKHKKGGEKISGGTERKRKPDSEATTPGKSRKVSSEVEEVKVIQPTQSVQCPLCMTFYPTDVIAYHAAVCGEEDQNTGSGDVELVSVSRPREQHPRETFIDLSDNMRLTEEQKSHWLNFSRKPKPYHPRMDNSSYKDHKLMKCPTCGQFYKSIEIEEHGDECAEKVNSGLVKRGLYLVKDKS